jgi:hypothetical protein
LEYFSKTTITKYAKEPEKIKNMQFFLEKELILEGTSESRESQVIDHVRFPDYQYGRVIDTKSRFPNLIGQVLERINVENITTLYLCFDDDITKLLPFRPDAAGYYVLLETKPGSGKVMYRGKEYSILSAGPVPRLKYDLDYKKSFERVDRTSPENGINKLR